MCAAMAMIVAPTSLSAQFNLKKAASAGIKAAKAFTLTDAQMADYVKESVDWMDRNNKVDAEDGEYTKRLRRLTEGITAPTAACAYSPRLWTSWTTTSSSVLSDMK